MNFYFNILLNLLQQQALFIEKAMSALGASTTDLASLISLQAALTENGVPPGMILETLKMLLQGEGSGPGLKYSFLSRIDLS